MADIERAESNLEQILQTPEKVKSLLVTGQRIRTNTLEAYLKDGRSTCLARKYDDIPAALVRLKAAGVDTTGADKIMAKLAARRVTRAK